MADGVGQFRPVQCVEMEMADAAGIKLPAEFTGDRCSDQLASSRKLVEAFEEPIQPFGNGSAAP